jgi:hypothetical protein
MRFTALSVTAVASVLLAACTADRSTDPESPSLTVGGVPALPPFNLQVILRPVAAGGSGFGLVFFRQELDQPFLISLDTWVRDLTPTTAYRLQRAVDLTPDDDCADALSPWLTLGAGLTLLAITTDDQGSGQAALFRSVAALPAGQPFDIKFQVIEDASGVPVLQSECLQYVIRG